MRAYGSVGTLLGVTIAVCALGCKQDLATGQGGTGGGVGTTGAGGSTQSTGGNTGGNTQSTGGNTGGSTLSTGGVGGITTSTGGVGGTTTSTGGVGGVAGAAGHPVSAVPSQHRPTATVCSDAGAPLSGYDGGLRGPTSDASITGQIRCTTANTCPACSNGLPDRCCVRRRGRWVRFQLRLRRVCQRPGLRAERRLRLWNARGQRLRVRQLPGR